MANDKNNPYKKSKDPYGPVRKQDPYVTGNRGGGYKNGGEGGGNGNGEDDNNDNCMVAAAPVIVGIGLVCALARFALRGRRD